MTEVTYSSSSVFTYASATANASSTFTVRPGRRTFAGILGALAGAIVLMAQVVTNKGKGWIGGFLAQATAAGSGDGSTLAVNVGQGEGSPAGTRPTAAVGDTTLTGAANESRVAGTRSSVTTTQTNDTYQVVATINATGTRQLVEVGLFDAIGSGNPPTGGNLVVHADFAVVNVSSGDSVQYTIKVQFT